MNGENKRDLIISELETMRKKETIEKNFFKARAYQKVIDQIKLIQSVMSFDDLTNVSGIGTKIRAKLEEIFLTGKLKAAERARTTGDIKVYDLFLKIHGIGVVKAKELVKLGIDSIESLREELEKNPSLLNETQRIGLKYYLDIQMRIPRKEMEKHARKISKLTCDIDPDLELKLVGSYRRGAADSGDIDVLVTIKRKTDAPKRQEILKKIIQVLKENDYLLADLATGSKKYMGISRLNKKTPARRIDILMTSEEEYPFALLYFTGDFQINISLRKKATELNYVLNEYGLKGVKNICSEKDIFNILGFRFLKPKDRNIQNLKEL
jgi:DNA polymerase/3'-5' exonuclease PolX